MSLNASIDHIDYTGADQFAIVAVHQWRNWLYNENDHRQRYELPIPIACTRRQAEYIVQCLLTWLPLVESAHCINPQKTTVLNLDSSRLSDEATAVFCSFLQQPNVNLVALNLSSHWPHHERSRPLMQSLHTNTFIKELEISNIQHADAGLWVYDMLQHKTDLRFLRFYNCRIRMADILPAGLRRGRHAHLRTLVFDNCAISDEGARLVLEAISRDGDFPSLKDLELRNNGITAVGLRCFRLAEQGSTPALCRLRKLVLSWNAALLNDAESTRLFVQRMLLSDDMSLKELYMADCGEHAPAIVKACESDKSKLQVLDMSNFGPFCQPIRDQLKESIPKMKKLEHWIFDSSLFAGDDNQATMLAAFRQNTSIVKYTMRGSVIGPPVPHAPITSIVNRNQSLKHADALLALQPKTHMPIGSKSGVWATAFAKMAPPLLLPPASNTNEISSSTNAVGYPGASAIFKILQKRPAILETQLQRPPAVAAAAGRHAAISAKRSTGQADGGSGVDTNNSLETHEAEGRKRRRV